MYLQGCNTRCDGCHNQTTWDINNGISIDVESLANELIAKITNKKLTISGGEPLMQQKAIIELLRLLKGFSIALYTSKQLKDVPKELKAKLDYIKVGKFNIDKITTVMPYIGSSNQKFIYLKGNKHETRT